MSDTLYDPAFDHDACGVGFVCGLNGRPTHDIVRRGLAVLRDLDHRGACGCDEDSGDGAGVLLQLPHVLFEGEGWQLPEPGDYGVAMVFLPARAAEMVRCMSLLEDAVRAEGQVALAWRRVPTRNEVIGEASRSVEPEASQLFIGRGSATPREDFEHKLYVIRKVFQAANREKAYIASLSSRTITYKGMLTPAQLPEYYPDLLQPEMASALALVHSRFSTNTFPNWRLAQPFRFLCHNGEINTLRGNINQMRACEVMFESRRFGEDARKLLPVIREGGSDSMALDNALELLYFTGRTLPHAMMMLVPEAWERNEAMSDAKRAFYQYHGNLMDPWDGPATLPFTDGRYVGALLDRNGLRPSRYTITKDGLVILASETGVGGIRERDVLEKGRLEPGKMFLVDLEEGRRILDEEIKETVSRRQPYRQWLADNVRRLPDLFHAQARMDAEERLARQRMFGYTLEDLRLLVGPMAEAAKEPLGSMGDDTPLAVLSDRPRLLYDYFKQLFAQVTNPPLDAIREELVTSLALNLGPGRNLFTETPEHCAKLRLEQPVIANIGLIDSLDMPSATLQTCFAAGGLEEALHALQASAEKAVREGAALLVLSDRAAGADRLPIPALLAVGAVHHHLIRQGLRSRCGLITDSGEPREIHHFALLIGYGAEAVCPYLALDTVGTLVESGHVAGLTPEKAAGRYIKAVGKGLLKVMSKMGISTLQSYRGAQIFEALGIGREVIDAYFTGTSSRIGGIGLDVIAEEAGLRHAAAYPDRKVGGQLDLDPGGRYQWRRGGERHLFDPASLARLHHAVRSRSHASYRQFADQVNEQHRHHSTLRGLLELDFEGASPVPLEEVEPWTEIVRSFKTGAMSNGSISREAHETLAMAMNAVGAKSNTGEGGENPERYTRRNPRRSRIKQVASGRFGVTIGYLESADEIQIKMAQGAKPGEGGQLPGRKVSPFIAGLRHSTPYVGLISPPPHHDIYSIEDLAQLIHDLKNANPEARISVKLVSAVGVGTVAAGVAKGKADVVLISGADGGTGASPKTSIMHAGLPWELGLSETHQTLVGHGLRERIRIECDGQLKTGRDVAVAALLGADEFGFASAPLVAMGCIMMRKCHLNTCPVGIATQKPELRKLFRGQPEHVINYLYFVAEELREIMARLGFRTLREMRGRADRLRSSGTDHWKAKHLDLAPLLAEAETPAILARYNVDRQDHGLDRALDHRLLALAEPALERQEPVRAGLAIGNGNRTVGTMLSHAISRKFGEGGLPEDTIVFDARGSAGQSFAAFGAPGLTFSIRGDANDYFGKGLSGAKLVIAPPEEATYEPHKTVLVGNVAFYGATGGEAYIRGRAGERFCVRNSGVRAVVEAVGDHGCEYMTGGRVVVLGPTGRNFAAGMSGGVAYVLDGTMDFRRGRCNTDSVELMAVTRPEDLAELRTLVENHYRYTGSRVAHWVLDHWDRAVREFVQVMPTEYRNALVRLATESPVVAVAAA